MPLDDGLVTRFLCQVDADEFLVVADKHTPLGECRMIPEHFATKTFPGWFQNVKSIEFFIACPSQACQNQIAGLTEEKEAILVLDQKRGRLPFAPFRP